MEPEYLITNNNGEYLTFRDDIMQRIRNAQYDAMRAVNKEMISLYWDIGRQITERQKELGWGKSVVENLSKDIQKEFPGIQGFGVRNIWNMARFYTEYQSNPILHPLVAEISWSKHICIMERCKDTQERRFYILATKRFSWTKNVLLHQIEAKAFENYLLGQSNYDHTLPDSVKQQAVLALRDDYSLSFLDIADEHSEHDLETAIVRNIRSFLMEFGHDFSFVGNQYRLEVGGQEYFIDLLLYSRRMKAMVAIELKVGDFKPEYKGKMEFYLNVLDDMVKLSHENPSIGIIICKSKNRTIVEYALRHSVSPIGVATYSISSELPDNYKEMLPTSQDIANKVDHLLNNI